MPNGLLRRRGLSLRIFCWYASGLPQIYCLPLSLGEKQPNSKLGLFAQVREGEPGFKPTQRSLNIRDFRSCKIQFHLNTQQKWPPTSRTPPTTSSGRPSVCAPPFAPENKSKKRWIGWEKKEFRRLLDQSYGNSNCNNLRTYN